jgi:hypothetical protein
LNCAADKDRVRADDVILELEELIRHAKPIPLTDQVRLDPDEVRQLIAELREALEAERRDKRL